MAEKNKEGSGRVTTKTSYSSVPEVVERLTALLHAKGVKVFDVIDQAVEARNVGLDLRPTVLVIFGNPLSGTPVMNSVPLSALDLPLKVVVWDDGGQTKVSYFSPEVIGERYELPQTQIENLRAIDVLTDAATVEPTP